MKMYLYKISLNICYFGYKIYFISFNTCHIHGICEVQKEDDDSESDQIVTGYGDNLILATKLKFNSRKMHPKNNGESHFMKTAKLSEDKTKFMKHGGLHGKNKHKHKVMNNVGSSDKFHMTHMAKTYKHKKINFHLKPLGFSNAKLNEILYKIKYMKKVLLGKSRKLNYG
jgi:hypothetical protein